METIRSALPPDLKQHPSEYVTGGRYYQSIEMSEGEKVTNMVADIVGDHVLMYASDYPHGESAFPESVNIVLSGGRCRKRASASCSGRTPSASTPAADSKA
jgi:single-stranded DNA-binding protein